MYSFDNFIIRIFVLKLNVQEFSAVYNVTK